MADTTGNQNLAIATNGTSHVPTATSPDACWLADKKTVVPFPNYVATKGSVHGGTTKTFIANQTVWIAPATIGPPSDPAHAGVGKGVASGTYRDVAKATSWSKDVKMEGQFVVRTGDATTQNKGNTTGKVLGSPLEAAADAAARLRKLACTIVSLDGACKHQGRKLGPPPGSPGAEPSYLEVLGGDEIELTAVRKDVHQNPEAPGRCTQAIHTVWVATRSASGEEAQKKKEVAKDAFKVGGALTEIKGLGVGGLGANATESSVEHGKLKVSEKSVGDFTKRSEGEANSYKRFDAPNRAGGSDKRFGAGGGRSIETGLPVGPLKPFSGGNNDLIKAARLWRALLDPPTITVAASACSGSKTAVLRVFPYGPFKFDLFSDKIKEVVDKIKRAADVGEKLGDAFGQPVKIRFLEGPAITFSIEYKELTKDFTTRDGRALYRVQVRRNWKIEAKFECLVAASLKFTMPLANFLGVVGAAAGKILKAMGLEGNVFMKLVLEFNPAGNLQWNEYDEWTAELKAEVVFTFAAGLEILAKIAEVTVYGYSKCTVEFSDPRVERGYLFGCTVKGGVQFGVKGAARVNLWAFETSKDFDWKPEWAKWPKDPGPGFFLPLVPEPV
ncbi:MAG: DUF4150 domain-containing protein [Polyangiaceae bacterium]|nr:DUF4150 domain-containing protein [Polyangiaceae bacterium]